VQLKSSIPIGAKVEISPKGLALGVKAETQKNIFNLLQVTKKCWTLWPCIGPKGEKTSTIKFGKPICNRWGRTKSQKVLEVGSKFFNPASWCKVGLVPTNYDKWIPNGCLLIGWMLLDAMLCEHRRCKSFNSVWYLTTRKIFYWLQEPKQIIPKGRGGWRRRRHHSPPILGSVMRKAPIVHNLKWLSFFCNIFQMEA